MATHSYNAQRFAATLVGVGLIGYSGWLTFEHARDIAAPIAAVVGAGMFHFGEVSLRMRRPVSGLLFGALGLLAITISLYAVIDRTSAAYDAKVHTAQSTNLPRVAAQNRLDEAKASLAAAEVAAAAECASGRKAKCLGLEQREEAARGRVAEARAALVGAGARQVEDPSARRIASVLGVPETAVATVQPLLLPIWLELSGLALLTFGLSPSRPQAETKAPKKRRRKARVAPRKPAHQDGVADWCEAYKAKHGRAPKVADVRQAFGVSKTTAWRRIRSAS